MSLLLPKVNKMIIKVECRSNYGVETYYPMCDKAKAFASIAGTKTLTVPVLFSIKALGYEVNVTHPMSNFLKGNTK